MKSNKLAACAENCEHHSLSIGGGEGGKKSEMKRQGERETLPAGAMFVSLSACFFPEGMKSGWWDSFSPSSPSSALQGFLYHTSICLKQSHYVHMHTLVSAHAETHMFLAKKLIHTHMHKRHTTFLWDIKSDECFQQDKMPNFQSQMNASTLSWATVNGVTDASKTYGHTHHTHSRGQAEVKTFFVASDAPSYMFCSVFVTGNSFHLLTVKGQSSHLSLNHSRISRAVYHTHSHLSAAGLLGLLCGEHPYESLEVAKPKWSSS